MEREFDENGIPKPLNLAELHAARREYELADADGKIAVLTKYPFLAGREWKRYQPAADPTPKAT